MTLNTTQSPAFSFHKSNSKIAGQGVFGQENMSILRSQRNSHSTYLPRPMTLSTLLLCLSCRSRSTPLSPSRCLPPSPCLERLRSLRFSTKIPVTDFSLAAFLVTVISCPHRLVLMLLPIISLVSPIARTVAMSLRWLIVVLSHGGAICAALHASLVSRS